MLSDIKCNLLAIVVGEKGEWEGKLSEEKDKVADERTALLIQNNLLVAEKNELLAKLKKAEELLEKPWVHHTNRSVKPFSDFI